MGFSLVDVVSGDTFATDANPHKVIEDCLIEVQCRYAERKTEDEYGEQISSGLDVILDHELVETNFSKREFEDQLKGYVDAAMEYWKDQGLGETELDTKRASLTKGSKTLLQKCRKMSFFLGTSTNFNGLVPLLEYPNPDDDNAAVLLLLKDGVREQPT